MAAAPGAPDAPTLTQTRQSLNVSWTAPANDGGSAITDYDVRYSSDGGTTWTETDDTSASAGTTVSLTGLTMGSTYQVQVRAGNADGDGNWSASASQKMNPMAPPDLTYRPCSTSGVTVLWVGRRCYLKAGHGGVTQFDSAQHVDSAGASVIELQEFSTPAGLWDAVAYNPMGGSTTIQTLLSGSVQQTFTIEAVQFGIRETSVSTANVAVNSPFTLTVKLNSPSHLSPDKYDKFGVDMARSWVQLSLPAGSGLTGNDHERSGGVSDPIQVVSQYGDTVTFIINSSTQLGTHAIGISAYRPLPDDDCPLTGDPASGAIRCYTPPVGSGSVSQIVSQAGAMSTVLPTLSETFTPTSVAGTWGSGSDADTLTVTWSSTDASSLEHEVVYRLDSSSTWTSAGWTRSLSKAISGLDSTATYVVTVRSRDLASGFYGAWAAEVTISP